MFFLISIEFMNIEFLCIKLFDFHFIDIYIAMIHAMILWVLYFNDDLSASLQDEFFKYMMEEAIRLDQKKILNNKSIFMLAHSSTGFKHSLSGQYCIVLYCMYMCYFCVVLFQFLCNMDLDVSFCEVWVWLWVFV